MNDPFKIKHRNYAIVPAAPKTPYEDMGLEQGTPEWRAARYEYITASDVSAIMGLSPYKKRAAVLSEKLTRTEPALNDFKRRLFETGHLAEDAGRRWANQNLNVNLRPAVLRSTIFPFLLASLDGFDPARDLFFEAKFMGAKSRQDVAARKFKTDHLIQVQTQFVVTGFKRCMYFATDENGDAEIQPIYPDPKTMNEIIEATQKFWAEWQAAKKGHL